MSDNGFTTVVRGKALKALKNAEKAAAAAAEAAKKAEAERKKAEEEREKAEKARKNAAEAERKRMEEVIKYLTRPESPILGPVNPRIPRGYIPDFNTIMKTTLNRLGLPRPRTPPKGGARTRRASRKGRKGTRRA